MARRVKIDRAKETYSRGQILAHADSGLTVSAYRQPPHEKTLRPPAR